MATVRRVTADLGSEEMKLVRKQLNRLTAFAEAVKAAAVTDGNTFQTNVAALTEDADFEEILAQLELPELPKPPSV